MRHCPLAEINGAERERLAAAGELETVGNLTFHRDDRGRMPCVKVWRGKARNPLHYYQFKTTGLREQHICRLIDEERQRAEVAAKYREQKAADPMARENVIATIRAALKLRSGKAWSVCGHRGTAWGWITITAPPSRCGEFGAMSEADRVDLAALLGLDVVYGDGVQIAASHDYYREYIDRAEGRQPAKIAEPYWD